MKNVFGRFRLIGWALGVWLSKRVITFLSVFDRVLYPRLLAQRRTARAAKLHGGEALAKKQFMFWVDFQPSQIHLLEKTLLSLAAQPTRNWRVRLLNQTEALQFDNIDINKFPVAYDRAGQSTQFFNLGHVLSEDIDFDCFLHAGDELEPDFLALIEAYSQMYDKAKLIYFDEDCICPDSRHPTRPWLKPDWSPEVLYSRNYLQRAVVFRHFLKDLMRYRSTESILGIPVENGWERLWDELAYALLEMVGKDHPPLQDSASRAIVHIPEILCHTIMDSERTGFNRTSGLRAHLLRRGIQSSEVLLASNGSVRVRWPVANSLVSIIIPNRDHFEELHHCLSSLYSLTAEPAFEVVLVDNNSVDPQTLEYYRQLENIEQARVVSGGEDFNFSKFCNLGARSAHGDILLFLNNDVEIIEPEWLHELVQFAILPDIGMVGGCLLYPDGTIQHAGIIIGLEGHAGHIFQGDVLASSGPFGSPDWYRNYLAVTGACMCIRRDLFAQVDGFDEAYHLVFSDVELGLRISRAGFRVVYNPFSRLVHFEGRSRKKYIPSADIHLGSQHLEDVVARGDPYFNPGLSHLVSHPTLLYPEIERESPRERLKRIEQWYG